VRVATADELFAEHRHGVFRYLCRMVGQVDAAHDLTQEVFLRIARADVPERDPAGLRAWVFTIARNLALNHARDGRRRLSSAELVETAEPAEPAVQELSVALHRALGALDDLDRDVFLLRETGGLSYAEIAATCELTVEAVRARLHRARVNLRSALDGPVRVHRERPVRFGGRN
jgi:RNA polymerase sigma-70 factor (ECF subfamily)